MAHQHLHPELLHLQQLAKELVHPEPTMLNSTAAISGIGFFPAAWGSTEPNAAIAGRPVMVLGQDQDNISGFASSLRKGYETYSPTWRNLLALFAAAAIPLEACFFTNFIMGIRVGSGRSTGPSPALAHPPFMRACAELFLEQLRLQQPRVIITLGMVPFQLLALVSTDLRYRALGITDFEAMDARGLQINTNVVFDAARGTTTTVVPICHPCLPQNGRRRAFSNATQYASEAAMLMYVMDTYVPDTALSGALNR